jgi:hypothetical protein
VKATPPSTFAALREMGARVFWKNYNNIIYLVFSFLFLLVIRLYPPVSPCWLSPRIFFAPCRSSQNPETCLLMGSIGCICWTLFGPY